MAVGFAERRFRLQPLGVDESLDHDLRFRRDQQIDGHGLHHVDRRAHETARDFELVEVLGIFWAETKVTAGGPPSTTAAGIFWPRFLYLSQCA